MKWFCKGWTYTRAILSECVWSGPKISFISLQFINVNNHENQIFWKMVCERERQLNWSWCGHLTLTIDNQKNEDNYELKITLSATSICNVSTLSYTIRLNVLWLLMWLLCTYRKQCVGLWTGCSCAPVVERCLIAASG